MPVFGRVFKITNGAIMKGQEVAAKVKGTWIHARVVKFVKKALEMKLA